MLKILKNIKNIENIKNNYGWLQLSLCGQKIYLCFKTKTHYVPHNLEIYLVAPFFTGQN